jgi:hypothetical protein
VFICLEHLSVANLNWRGTSKVLCKNFKLLGGVFIGLCYLFTYGMLVQYISNATHVDIYIKYLEKGFFVGLEIALK